MVAVGSVVGGVKVTKTKRIVCAAFLASVFTSSAFADDWTGFYLGIQGGYGWTGTASTGILDPFNALGPGAGAGTPGTFLFDPDASGGMVGGHIGYNWQASSNLVLGGEVDWSWSDINGSAGVSPIPYPTDVRPGSSVAADLDINSLGSARARLAYAMPSQLVYVTGGVAWANYDASSNIVCPQVNGGCGTGVHSPGSVSDTRVGWVIGAGTDIRLGASGWLLGVEYLYYRFDGSDQSNTQVLELATGTPNSFGSCPSDTSPCVGHFNGDFDVNTVKGRLSYQF